MVQPIMKCVQFLGQQIIVNPGNSAVILKNPAVSFSASYILMSNNVVVIEFLLPDVLIRHEIGQLPSCFSIGMLVVE